MARLFDDASNEYLTYGTAIVTGYPFAFSVHFRSNDDANTGCLIGLADAGSTSEEWRLAAMGTVDGDPIRFRCRTGGANRDADTSVGYTANTWQHAAVIALSATERHVYLEGGNKGSNTTDSTPANLDNTSIGGQVRSSLISEFSGDIAEAAIWDLTAWGGNDAARETAFEAAIASLVKGYSPLFFPLGLVSYWPLVRGLNDRISGYNMTVGAGTVVSAHPRIIYPSQIWVPSVAAAAPPVGAAGIMTTNTGFWGPTF